MNDDLRPHSVTTGSGDDLDVAAGRCCPTCRHDLTPHNVDVWNAGYSICRRHMQSELAAAWDAGWHEHYLEWDRQRVDPNHPITKSNPFEERR